MPGSTLGIWQTQKRLMSAEPRLLTEPKTAGFRDNVRGRNTLGHARPERTARPSRRRRNEAERRDRFRELFFSSVLAEAPDLLQRLRERRSFMRASALPDPLMQDRAIRRTCRALCRKLRLLDLGGRPSEWVVQRFFFELNLNRKDLAPVWRSPCTVTVTIPDEPLPDPELSARERRRRVSTWARSVERAFAEAARGFLLGRKQPSGREDEFFGRKNELLGGRKNELLKKRTALTVRPTGPPLWRSRGKEIPRGIATLPAKFFVTGMTKAEDDNEARRVRKYCQLIGLRSPLTPGRRRSIRAR